MTLPVTVTAFACVVCESIHKLEADADKCCRCPECGGLHPPDIYRGAGYRSMTCGRCAYSGRLKSARDEVGRHRKNLDAAQARVDKMLAEGRPQALPEARRRKFTPIEGGS